MNSDILHFLPIIPIGVAFFLFVTKHFAEVYKVGLWLLMSSIIIQLFYLFLMYNDKIDTASADSIVLNFFVLIEEAILLIWLMMRLQKIDLREFNLYRTLMALGILTQLYLIIQAVL